VLDDPEAAAQLLQVQLRVQALTHPNIQAVYDVIRKELEIYVALEHQPGVTLLQVLRKLRETGPFPPPVAGFVVWQVCLGLDHAHHLKQEGRPVPLIHGALWPQNILCSFKGEIRLGGFGTWVIPRTESEEVSIRTQFGYRSPEHVSGEPLSRSTDLFCIGVLLAEMLLARPILLGKTLMETVQRVESAEVGELTGVPPQLQKVLRRCLAARPSDRYADIAAFISELGVVVHGMGDRAVRQDLVTFLNTQFQPRVREPAKPAPLPGAEDDETTNISPRDLADALRALSRERTEPGRLPKKLPEKVVDLQPIESDDGAEPTRVDHDFAPQPTTGVSAAEIDADEGPTALSAPPQITVTWEEAPARGSVEERLLTTDPGGPALFPPDEDERTATSETSPEILTSTARSSPHLPAAPFAQEFADDETTTHGRGGAPVVVEEETTKGGRAPAAVAVEEETTKGGRGTPVVPDEEPTASTRVSAEQTTNPIPGGRLASTLVEDPTRDSVVDEMPTNRMSPVLVEAFGGGLAAPKPAEEVPTQNAKPISSPRASRPRTDSRRDAAERTPVVAVESDPAAPARRGGPPGAAPLAGRREAGARDGAAGPRRDPTGRAPALRADAAPPAAPRRDPTGRAPALDPPRRPTPRAGPPAVAPRRDPTGRAPALQPSPAKAASPARGAPRPSPAPPVIAQLPDALPSRPSGGLPTLDARQPLFEPGPPRAPAAVAPTLAPTAAPAAVAPTLAPTAPALAPTLPPTAMAFPHADEAGNEASQEATNAVDPGLFFEGPSGEPQREPPGLRASAPEGFDPDAFSAAYYSSYGASHGAAKGFRFTLAHGMLLVAILVFLVAVALLVRRVMVQRRPARTPPAKVVRAEDARPPATTEPIPGTGTGSGAKPGSGTGAGPGPSPPAPSGLPAGQLRIELAPPVRAAVYLDRKRVGRAPLTTLAKPGATAELVIAADGFELHRERVTIPAASGLAVRVALRPGGYFRAMKRNGTLFIKCKKKDTRRIFIDDRDTGVSCPTRKYFRLSAKKHPVQLYSIEQDRKVLYIAKVKRGRRTTVYVTR
jgi:serine/threonine protein kinase